MDRILAAIEKLHASPLMACVAVTGAGGSAISWLMSVGGCSKTLLEATIPYAVPALELYVGKPVPKAVSEQASRDLALAAYQRAVRLRPATTSSSGSASGTMLPVAAAAVVVVGVGCTASIATTRDRRGLNQLFVSSWSENLLKTYHIKLVKGQRDRAGEDHVVSSVVIKALCDCANVPLELPFPTAAGVDEMETLHVSALEVRKAWFDATGRRSEIAGPPPDLAPDVVPVVYPGSYNPLHKGHEQLAEVASKAIHKLTGKHARVFFELAAVNVDKGEIAEEVVQARAAQFRGKFDLMVTRTPKFVDKVKLFPGHAFIVGYDTAKRLVDVKYTNNNLAQLLQELQLIRDAGCWFVVAGRESQGKFYTLQDLQPPQGMPLEDFHALFPIGLTEQDFRVDLSSTLLRQQMQQMGGKL